MSLPYQDSLQKVYEQLPDLIQSYARNNNDWTALGTLLKHLVAHDKDCHWF